MTKLIPRAPAKTPARVLPIAIVFLFCGLQICHAQTQALTRSIPVPLDYTDPHSPTAMLSFEFGAPFNRAKPTVILVADGQQYFVQPGAAARLQNQIFGDGFNVVGLIPRGSRLKFIHAAVGPDGKPDWLKAWRIFNAGQWIEDIERVRREVVGKNGQVMLYGRSGGAYLVHQYLAQYGAHVSRAFTQSSVNPRIVRELGFDIDTFWQELGQQDPALQPLLLKALASMTAERQAVLLTLQRQHFYVPGDQLAAARAKLVRSLAVGDLTELTADRKQYEVDDILKLEASNDRIPQEVRVLELLYPTGAFNHTETAPVQPLIETQTQFIQPLLALVAAKAIPAPDFDETPSHALSTEILMLAGRWDEAVDYRTQIALAYMYPKHFLFIAGDNHVFEKMEASHTSAALIRSFLQSGPDSPEFTSALKQADAFRWKHGV